MESKNKTNLSDSANKKLLIAIGIISFLNLLCAYYTEWPDNMIQNLDGTFASNQDIKTGNYRMILLNTPLLGLIIGSIASFIPYKKFTYREKWVSFVIVTILILAMLTLLSLGISFIRYKFGI